MPKSSCPLCDDGWPLVEIHGEMIHELPEPAGNFICFARARLATIPFVYIMSPYMNHDPEVMELRYQIVRSYMNRLIVEFPNAVFYSSIVHFHQVALDFYLPRDIDYWRAKNACMIHRCQLGIVLREPGWVESEGIMWERELFNTLHIPYIKDDTNSEHEVVGQALSGLT